MIDMFEVWGHDAGCWEAQAANSCPQALHLKTCAVNPSGCAYLLTARQASLVFVFCFVKVHSATRLLQNAQLMCHDLVLLFVWTPTERSQEKKKQKKEEEKKTKKNKKTPAVRQNLGPYPCSMLSVWAHAIHTKERLLFCRFAYVLYLLLVSSKTTAWSSLGTGLSPVTACRCHSMRSVLIQYTSLDLVSSLRSSPPKTYSVDPFRQMLWPERTQHLLSTTAVVPSSSRTVWATSALQRYSM